MRGQTDAQAHEQRPAEPVLAPFIVGDIVSPCCERGGLIGSVAAADAATVEEEVGAVGEGGAVIEEGWVVVWVGRIVGLWDGDEDAGVGVGPGLGEVDGLEVAD